MIVLDVIEHVRPIDGAAEGSEDVELIVMAEAERGRAGASHRDTDERTVGEAALASRGASVALHDRLVGAEARREERQDEGRATVDGDDTRVGDGDDARCGNCLLYTSRCV